MRVGPFRSWGSVTTLSACLLCITDQGGAVIGGATVTVTDAERGVSRNLVTGSAGQYTAPSLTPGQYTVRAEAAGFRAVERANITLGVGKPSVWISNYNRASKIKCDFGKPAHRHE